MGEEEGEVKPVVSAEDLEISPVSSPAWRPLAHIIPRADEGSDDLEGPGRTVPSPA